jgi:predicted Zn-dependent protease with MMP-like domain
LPALDQNEIRKEVARVLDRLPRQFRSHLSNVEVVVEARPGPELLLAEGLDPRTETLYGLYQGVPLPDRSEFYPPILPDKITIFSEPLLRDFPDPADLAEQIRLTVLHEIAHYFGMDEEDIDKLGY